MEETIKPIHKAQLPNYLTLLKVPQGLLINIYEVKLIDGVSRLIPPGANLK